MPADCRGRKQHLWREKVGRGGGADLAAEEVGVRGAVWKLQLAAPVAVGGLIFVLCFSGAGGGNDIQWCFSQVKGAVDDDVAEGKSNLSEYLFFFPQLPIAALWEDLYLSNLNRMQLGCTKWTLRCVQSPRFRIRLHQQGSPRASEDSIQPSAVPTCNCFPKLWFPIAQLLLSAVPKLQNGERDTCVP